MENKTNSLRGRPKKDFGELKNKLAIEAAENKGKFKRGRPKKQRLIEDSVNTKISNHHKDIAVLEKKNREIHENIGISHSFDNAQQNTGQNNDTSEKYSKIALIFSIILFIFAVIYRIGPNKIGTKNKLAFSEINSSGYIDSDAIQMQIGFNNESGEFVEVQNIEINNGETEKIQQNNEESIIDNIGTENIGSEINNEDIDLIKQFYSKINSRDFSGLSDITDKYLKSSNAYKTYFSANWLNNFLDKITGNKIFIGGFYEVPNDKPNVKNYRYSVKYKVNSENRLTNEEWEVSIVDRNGDKLIGSIMCITTGCSKMPFFQK